MDTLPNPAVRKTFRLDSHANAEKNELDGNGERRHFQEVTKGCFTVRFCYTRNLLCSFVEYH